MNKTIKNIKYQSGATIRTLYPNPVAQAFIYCEEQRAKIVQLISHGFKPHHTSVGVGKTGKDLEAIDKALEDYQEEHEDENLFYSFHEFKVVDD